MNLNQLLYFNKVAELGHVTKAAEALYISQPSLSYAISKLESELGVPLFEHQGRNITLSIYGQKLYQYTQEAIEILDEGMKEVHKMANEASGHIKIACINTVAGDFVPALMAEYLKQYTNTTFEVKSTSTLEVIRLLKEAKADIGFCTEIEDETINFVPLFTQEFVAVVPKNHPLSKLRKMKISQLMDYPLIGYTKSLPIAKMVDAIFEDADLKPDFVQRHDDEIIIGGMVMQGFGVGIVANTPFLKQFPLKIIPLDIANRDIRQIHLAYVKDKFRSYSEEKMISFILERKKA